MEREISVGLQRKLNFAVGDLKEYFPKLETQLEDKLIKLLKSVHIRAIRKTDKYSLPYKDELVKKIHTSSFINDMFDEASVFRPILKELLNKNAYKIRFYFHIETYGNGEKFFGNGIKYSFRYTIHELPKFDIE